MNTHPEKWYILLSPENYNEVRAWWVRQVEKSGWSGRHLDGSFIVLSKHPSDESHYWFGYEFRFNHKYPSYQKITLEQFRQITNSTPTPKPMTKSIQISRDLLNEYYEAATGPQKEYLTEHFKLDGTTTDEAIRGLHKMACSKWQPRIRKNHPECFPDDSKYFDFSAYVMARGNCGIVKDDVAKSLGLSNDFIQIRGYGSANQNRSFFLTPEYDWELVQDGSAKVLIPTKKQS